MVCCNPKLKVKAEVPTQFDFLGFTFRKRVSRRKDGVKFTGFGPGISNKAKKTIVREMRDWKLRGKTMKTMADVSREINAQIRGWLNYYGEFNKSSMSHLVYMIEFRLIHWAQAKYKTLTGRVRQVAEWLRKVKSQSPSLFAHWGFWNGKMAE